MRIPASSGSKIELGDNAEQPPADKRPDDRAKRHHKDEGAASPEDRKTTVAAIAGEADDHCRQTDRKRKASRKLDIHAEQQDQSRE